MEVNKLRLFINEGICKRKWNNNVIIHKKNGVVTLKIPNYNEATYKQTYMEFIIPHIEESMLKTDVWMYNLVLEECTENRIVFSEKYDSCTGEIYALIRSTEVVPDDVYIPKEKSTEFLKASAFFILLPSITVLFLSLYQFHKHKL